MTPVNYTLMQYNILHQKDGWGPADLLALGLETRKTNVVKAIKDYTPDVLFLAERHDEWAGVGESSVDLGAALGADYAIVEDLITYDGVTAVNRTPIVYNTKTFRCVESGFLKLTEEATFAASNNKRVVSWAVLEDITDTNAKGQKIIVLCTHWSAGDTLQSYRIQQATEIKDLINTKFKQFPYVGVPVIIGGDFNSGYESTEYQTMINGSALIDTDTTNTARIDRFAIYGCDVVSCTTKAVSNASDHHPIYCEIKIEN